MKQKFILNIRSYSVNAMYSGDLRFKRTEAIEWMGQFFHSISTTESLEKLKQLREHFDPKKHSYFIAFTEYYPASVFYNSNDEISSRTVDITNFEKPLLDLLFDKRYFTKQYPYGCPNLNQNDKFVTDMVSRKRPHSGDNRFIEIVIKIKNRPTAE